MASWLGLLAGCVIAGAAFVAALILPRSASPLAALVGAAALFGAISTMGSIVQRYDTSQAITAALVILIAGLTAGFAVAAAALPLLYSTPRVPLLAERDTAEAGQAVVLLACTDPERYSPRVMAYRQNLIAETTDIGVPSAAAPFVFFAEKARYRAAGRALPGESLARSLATRIGMPSPALSAVDVAWCYAPGSLAQTVAARASRVRDVAIVIAGPVAAAWIEASVEVLDRLLKDAGDIHVTFGPPVWNDRLFAARMTERIMAATAGADPGSVGVVLVGEGLPPGWEKRYPDVAITENYFNQRVRALLSDAGVDDRCVRTASIDWQTPDVTESVRHVGALGCSRIIVAPSTIALPTLETVLDLDHLVKLARIPDTVSVVTLTPWGDDEGFADALRRSATAALGELSAEDR